LNRSQLGAALMITVGIALFLLAFARHEREWSFLGLACGAIGFGRLYRPRS